MENVSGVKVFHLSVLNETWTSRYFLFSLTLFVYSLILFVNVMLILTITLQNALHEPMYMFLCNLCINGLYGTAGFYPKFLSDLLSGHHVISYEGCFLQAFVIYSSVQCEFSTLTVMSYDRYVAICKPLMYHSIMTGQMVYKLITFCWLFPYFMMSLLIALSRRLTLCGSHIDKLYCENWSIVKLSCEATVVNNVTGFIVILTFLVFAIFTTVSYIKLISVCTKSREDRIKFMQTCVPHLCALTNFTVTLMFDTMYSRYGSRDISERLRNFLALQFLIIPPLFNPIIYGLKLTEVRKRLLKQCRSLK
ncbi:olfactory receptor 52D1-like [Anguilla rostrata]|uniref:olfactory receptor 52D1-like n=1 Tax=Anguilla anguilla TaxID=7936 RepID=UPI0015B2076E|nr:olfactory receptor 52D1-like [Anguilla anguilla]XP_035241856.1 olfactory receptor 52D1-like [Anguilla anguilla]